MKKSKYEINSMSFDIEKNGDIKVNVNFDTKNFKNIFAVVYLSRFDNKYEVEYASRHTKLHVNGSYYKLETDNIYGSIISALDQIISKADAKLTDAFGLNKTYRKFAQSISFEGKVEYVIDENFNPSELSCILHAKMGNYEYCFWVKAKIDHTQYYDVKYAINAEVTDQNNSKLLEKQFMMTRDEFNNVSTCMKILKQHIMKPLYWELCVNDLEKANHVKVRKYKLHWKE